MIPAFSPARLIAVTAAVLLSLLPLYFLVIRADEGRSRGIEAARLLETPSSASSTAAVGVMEGRLAQDFEISTPDAERIRLSDLRGRPVLINFWATWCGSCLSEMPEIKALQADRGHEQFTVLAINAGETPDQALEFIDFLDAPFVYGLDLDLRVSDAFGVYGLPLSVFIDSDGVIQAVYRGHANRALLETFTDAAISARPPGEVPVVLRLISRIPRDRVLSVTSLNAGSLLFSSRSLRCDPSYCSREAVGELELHAGVISTKLDLDAMPEPTLEVSFDPAVIPSERLIDLFAATLGALDDELYSAELQVRPR